MAWKTLHPDAAGNCTIRLGSGVSQGGFKTLQPVDKSGLTSSGKFPCGREQSNYDGKLIKLPSNLTCDACTLQVEFETKASGKLFMCADMEIIGGQIEDCAGQCVHGAVCMNGGCECRKGYSGRFCEIVESVPSNTNYTLYLKYFLFLIVMVLAIVLLLAAAYFLFKKSGVLKTKMQELIARNREQVSAEEEDPDNIGGAGIDDRGENKNMAAQRQLFE